MSLHRRWFDRRFELGLSPDAVPDLIERLRGTPGRLEERTGGIPIAALTSRLDGTWSIQENIGHLLDLESLWAGRLDDFARNVTQLRAADLENRRTWDADHNRSALATLLAAFRAAREAFVSRVERLSVAQLNATALHPRLQQPMSVADHCFFVAEHDDHHLARISELIRRGASHDRLPSKG